MGNAKSVETCVVTQNGDNQFAINLLSEILLLIILLIIIAVIVVVAVKKYGNNVKRQTRKELRNIQEPVILFQGTQDKTIDPTGAMEAYEQIGSDSRELVVLRESEHIILLDRQLPEVQQKCLEFILRNSGELA